jgi:hypothetical protein
MLTIALLILALITGSGAASFLASKKKSYYFLVSAAVSIGSANNHVANGWPITNKHQEEWERGTLDLNMFEEVEVDQW